MTIGTDDQIRAFLADEARRVAAAAPSLDQAAGRLAPRVGARERGSSQRLMVLLLATLLLAAALGGAIAVGSNILRLPPVIRDPVDLGIFETLAGRIVYATGSSLWGVDASATTDSRTRIVMTSVEDIPLGWSSDGTRLLVRRQSQFFVLHADGSETEVGLRPASGETIVETHGATLSPDGSRVVFVGLTRTSGGACCDYALYAANANGGPSELLVQARYLVEDPTFSPDGRQIAYVDGFGDRDQSVWIVNVDGSNPHQILANDTTTTAGHASGLAWSPAGDRIALALEGTIYTFAPDGSAFRPVITGGDRPYWSPDGSQLVYAVSCFENGLACTFAIADADGTNARELGSGVLGPWHPATDSP